MLVEQLKACRDGDCATARELGKELQRETVVLEEAINELEALTAAEE